MKTYILTLKQKSGLLSDLQSDTIYGHFCWRLKEKSGVEKLTSFISAYQYGQPIFTISDGLLKVNEEIYFPRPYIFSKQEVKQTKTEKVLEFVKRKANKERNYMTLVELNKFLHTGQLEILEKTEADIKNDKQKKRRPISTEALRVSVQIDRNTFGSREGRLFSYNPKYTREDVSYVVLIKVLDESSFDSFECESIIKEVFKVGFGKKKTSGYGQFELQDEEKGLIEFKELDEPKDSNAFMVLGNYLPSEEDRISPIGYDINTKYGKLGEELSLSDNPFKNPIIFLTAGSCFKTLNKMNAYGRVTYEGEVSGSCKFAVQFGMPLTLNFNLP